MSVALIWVKDIFIMILSVAFIQILLPDSSLSKYLKFIFSIIILATILNPLQIWWNS